MEFKQVKAVKISQLKVHPKNPRVHPKSAIDKLIRSIQEFGFTNPVLASKDGYILAGHARCKAAEEAGIEEVPVIFLDLDGAKADAYLIADNKIQEETTWDSELLADLIQELQDSDFNVAITGFEPPEIEQLFNSVHDKKITEDDFDIDEELKNPCFSKEGDLWILGRHKVLCGDATKEGSYQRLMEGIQANVIVTDPPYLVSYQGKAGSIQNDDLKGEEAQQFLLAAFQNMYANLAEDGSIYVFHADSKGLVFRQAYEEAGFYLSGCCIWVKDSLVLGRSPYQWRHEPILFGWKKEGKHQWYSDRKQSTIFEFPRPKKNIGHPTCKPVALMAYPIKNSSMTNGIVLDPFLGSGSTLIACAETGRECRGIELDPKYMDVLVKRFVEYRDGKTDDVYVERDGQKLKFEEVSEVGSMMIEKKEA